jgi:hypothetical protein
VQRIDRLLIRCFQADRMDAGTVKSLEKRFAIGAIGLVPADVWPDVVGGITFVPAAMSRGGNASGERCWVWPPGTRGGRRSSLDPPARHGRGRSVRTRGGSVDRRHLDGAVPRPCSALSPAPPGRNCWPTRAELRPGSAGVRPARTSSMICFRNSPAHGGIDLRHLWTDSIGMDVRPWTPATGP